MRTAILVVAMAMIGGCGGTEDPAPPPTTEQCVAQCKTAAEGAGYPGEIITGDYCPDFCLGAGECRCLFVAWLPEGKTVCEAASDILCPMEN